MMMKNNEFVALSPGNLLWERIRGFSLDDPDARMPFSKKLAREQKWDEAFTRWAIEEYKRFIYLCCISPTGASPSEVVDRVWHHHLLYTENYWEVFCEGILGKKIHHYPSTGGAVERKKYADWQEDTGQLYRRCFGEDPPPAIWSNKKPFFSTFFKRFTAFPRRWLITLLLFFFLFFTGCNGNNSAFSGWVFAFLGLAWLLSLGSNEKDKSKKSGDTSSCSSGSSCGSSCGSGCGGGCGGCGS